MNNELRQILELQEMDKVIDRLNLDFANLPLLIEAKRCTIQQDKNLLEEKKNQCIAFQLKRKEKELELAAQEERIHKHEGELNSLKSNESYRAMLGEIDSVKRKKGETEDEILKFWEELDRANSEIKNIESEARTRQSALESEIKEMEAQIQKTKEHLESELKKRTDFALQLPGALTSVYDFIRDKKKGIAVVYIDGETCSGCHTNLTQSTINEVKKAKVLVQCDSCSRILYEPEPKAVAAAPVVP